MKYASEIEAFRKCLLARTYWLGTIDFGTKLHSEIRLLTRGIPCIALTLSHLSIRIGNNEQATNRWRL
jgi:hypothetical protein